MEETREPQVRGERTRRTRLPRPRSPFDLIVTVVFVAILGLISVGALTVGREGAKVASEMPRSIVMTRHMYGSYGQYAEDLRLGQGVGEIRLEMREANKWFVSYGGMSSDCSLSRVEVQGYDACYTATPTSRDVGWTARFKRPINPDGSMVGLWALRISRTDDSLDSSDWLLFNGDGTGMWGQGDYDAFAMGSDELAELGSPLTWKSTPCDAGALITLKLEAGGESTILFTR